MYDRKLSGVRYLVTIILSTHLVFYVGSLTLHGVNEVDSPSLEETIRDLKEENSFSVKYETHLLDPFGIAEKVIVENITDSSAIISWKHLKRGKDNDYHLVGYEIDDETYDVIERVQDIAISGDAHWQQSVVAKGLNNDATFLFCLIPVRFTSSGAKTHNEILNGKDVIKSSDCVSFKTHRLSAACSTPGYIKLVAVLASCAIFIWIFLCIVLIIIRYSSSNEDEDEDEDKDDRSFLSKLVGHANNQADKKTKHKPSEKKYLGEYKPEFGEITEEVNKVVKD